MPSKPAQHRPIGRKPRQAHRLKTAERGYDSQWQRISKMYRRVHPECEMCGELATDTDHRIPFNGKGDPLRLQWDNLQALCSGCHDAKTAAQKANKMGKTGRDGGSF